MRRLVALALASVIALASTAAFAGVASAATCDRIVWDGSNYVGDGNYSYTDSHPYEHCYGFYTADSTFDLNSNYGSWRTVGHWTGTGGVGFCVQMKTDLGSDTTFDSFDIDWDLRKVTWNGSACTSTLATNSGDIDVLLAAQQSAAATPDDLSSVAWTLDMAYGGKTIAGSTSADGATDITGYNPATWETGYGTMYPAFYQVSVLLGVRNTPGAAVHYEGYTTTPAWVG